MVEVQKGFLARKFQSPSQFDLKRLTEQDKSDNDFENKSVGGAVVRKAKSKDELAQLRKQMMRKKFRPPEASIADTTSGMGVKTPTGGSPLVDHPSRQTNKSIHDKKYSLKDSKSEDALMSRLASGQKVPVDPKQMKKLTIKNYSQLPEVIKKQEEERKQKDYMEKK